MTTDFGKFTRKLRVDNDELMKDMASKLGVTSSYLSAVEKGKRKVPLNWSELITMQYDLTEKQSSELAKVALINQLSEREKQAINAALAVIHLNDSSDYINGLWEVLRALLGENIVEDNSFSVKEWTNLLGTFKD